MSEQNMFVVTWNRQMDAKEGLAMRERLEEILEKRKSDPTYAESEYEEIMRGDNPFPEWVQWLLEQAFEYDPINRFYYRTFKDQKAISNAYNYIGGILAFFHDPTSERLERVFGKSCKPPQSIIDMNESEVKDKLKLLEKHLVAKCLDGGSPYYDDLLKQVTVGM